MIYYVCKYTPIELFRGFGEECSVLEEMPENFEQSDQIAHANLCGFGKSVIQAVLEGKVEQLVLVNCCDSMRRVYDIVESTGKCKFLYMLDLPHDDNECEKVKFAGTIRRLKKAYEAYSGKVFINVNIKMYIFDHLRMYIFAILPLDRYIFLSDKIFL